MLTIHCGRENALRREMLLQADAVLRRGEKCMALVPEQVTLKTERFFLEGLNLPGSFDLEVLSPSRLTERVFELEGREPGERVSVDLRGKAVAVADAVRSVKKDLDYYTASEGLQGFVEQCATLIGDLKRAGMTPEQLTDYAAGLPDGGRKDKLGDLAKIYSAYRDRIGKNLVDGEDVNREMLRRLEGSSRFGGMEVLCLDFDVLTASMIQTVVALCLAGAKVSIWVRYEAGENLYRPVGESLGRLREEARSAGIDIRTVSVPGFPEQGPEDLRHLREAFVWDEIRPWKEPPQRIRLVAAATPYDEMAFVAGEMRRLHETMPWSSMALVFLSPEEYAGPAQRLLRLYGIPCYIPRKQPAVSHEAVRFVLCSLRCVFRGYRQEDLLSLLSTGFVPVEDREAWQLSNYVSAWGIRGKTFLGPFTRGEEAEREEAAAIRDSVTAPMKKLHDALTRNMGCTDLLRAVVEYLEETGLYERLQRQEEELLRRGMDTQAAQGRQMWAALMNCFDQISQIMGNEPVSREDLLTQIEAAMRMYEVRSLPPESGVVMCAEAGSATGEGAEAVFITGFNDDAFSPPGEGLIADEERKGLEAWGKASISLDADGREDLNRLDLYRALCAAGSRLYLTRAMASQKGEAKRAHPYLQRIRDIFPLLVEEGSVAVRMAGAGQPQTPDQAAEELAVLLSRPETPEANWAAAWRTLTEQYPDKARAVLEAFRVRDAEAPLSRKITRSIFPERSMSVSRLETFAVCPYRHFVEYGLKPVKKQEWQVTSQAAGSFYHSALERFMAALTRLPGWPDCSRREVDALVQQTAEPLFGEQFGELEAELPRVKALKEKYLRVLRRVAWTFTQSARTSAFTLTGCEVRFGFPEEGSLPPVRLSLPDGSEVLLRGVIDRIDRYEGDEGLYFRVVDYKSGSRKLEPEQIYYGTQLQLLIYLAALAEPGNAQPAGAYYMHLADPLIPEPEEQKDLEKELARKLHLSGITLRDARIVQLMDASDPPLSMERLLKKDGDFMANKPVADMENLKNMILHARESARKMCVSMRGGRISRDPLIPKGQRSPCEYCDYGAVCRVEEAHPRRCGSMTYEELYALIRT